MYFWGTWNNDNYGWDRTGKELGRSMKKILVPARDGSQIPLAQVAGFVALFAPAGIGVCEGVLIIGLQGMMGTGPAIVVTVVTRLWQTALDLTMAGAGAAGLRYSSPEYGMRSSKFAPPIHTNEFQ